MRFSPGGIANGLACVGLAAAFAFAVMLADLLGFLGLLIVGAGGWLVCTRAAQDEDPRWYNGPAWRSAPPDHPARPPTVEQRAAQAAQAQRRMEPIRFLARCSMALAAIGAAGFAWQCWAGAASNAH